MAKCEECGKEFDEELAKEEFEDETYLEYSMINKKLCYDCAMEDYEAEADDLFFAQCDKCGKIFNYFETISNFDSAYDYGAYSILDGNYCFDCAEDVYFSKIKPE